MDPRILTSGFFNEIAKFFLNLIGKKNTYQIIVTGKDYSRLEIFWGLICYEKGEKREILITGTDKYINNIIAKLERQKFKVNKFTKVIDNKISGK